MIKKIKQYFEYRKNKKIVKMVLSELSQALQTDNERLLEILTYIAQLSQRDIQNIITDAVVNTMDN